MLSITITFLTGRYNAADVLGNPELDTVEWPPHPARLFAGLVAVLYEQLDNKSNCRDALLWLESQDPPALSVPENIRERGTPYTYCPQVGGQYEEPEDLQQKAGEILREIHQNPSPELWAKLEALLAAAKTPGVRGVKVPRSEHLELTGKELATAGKTRPPFQWAGLRDRVFPSGTIHNGGGEARVAFLWDVEVPPQHVEALRTLGRRLPYLGRSSSPIVVQVDTNTQVPPTLVPCNDGEIFLRVPCVGVLDELDRTFASHLGVNRRLTACEVQAYGTPKVDTPEITSCMQNKAWVILEQMDGPNLLARETYTMARLIRRKLLNHLGEVPPMLSGHDGDKPASDAHLAVVGLPITGERGAGRIKGFALILPRAADFATLELLQRAAHRVVGDVIGDRRFRVLLDVPKGTLAPSRWSRASTVWSSVTPMVLDRGPGKCKSPSDWRRADRVVAEGIVRSCVFMGLPEPSEVRFTSVSPILGVEPANVGPRGWSVPHDRSISHVQLTFPVPVTGPVLLGAGRFYGLGLFLPETSC